MNQRVYLNENWLYSSEYSDDLKCESFNESNLKPVRIPHTNVETPFHYFDESVYQFVSGYRRKINAPEDWKGKSVILTFEGVGHEATVFLNGDEVAFHQCGYTAFSVDISEKLISGTDNLLTVKVNSKEDINVPPFGFVIDYMTYGGIYRDVYIDVLDKCHFENLYVFPKVSVKDDAVKKAGFFVSFELSRETEGDFDIELSYAPHKSEEYKVIDSSNGKDFEIRIREGRKIFEKKGLIEDSPKLWSPDEPNLYDFKIKLLSIDIDMVSHYSIELHQEAVVVTFVLNDIVILFVLSFKLVLSFLELFINMHIHQMLIRRLLDAD